MRGLPTASQFQRIQPYSHGVLKTQFLFSPASLQYARLASTTTSLPAKTPRPSPVNGPATTLPATLNVPVRGEDQPFFPSYALALGKSYLNFYKTGVKNIYTNFRLSRHIQHTIDSQHASSLSSAVSSGALSRSDFQLLIRNWHDIKRVPIFALVFMICGEFTPLIVIALSNIVPWTCRIPKQVESDRRKLEQRRSTSFRNLITEPPTEERVDKLRRPQLLHISWSLGLSSQMWDWVGGLPTGLLRRKVTRRVHYLELDDGLIRNAGGVREMNSEEVKMALVARGVDVLGKKDPQLKGDLNAWLKSREKVPAERLLLTRPSIWPFRSKAPEMVKI